MSLGTMAKYFFAFLVGAVRAIPQALRKK